MHIQFSSHNKDVIVARVDVPKAALLMIQFSWWTLHRVDW
jgi:hypothetical protein